MPIMSSSQLSTELAEPQVEEIVAFMGTLTGTQPQIVHPILPVHNRHPWPQPMLK